MKIPYLDLRKDNERYRSAMHHALDSFLDANTYVLGQAMQQFEAEYAAYIGTGHAIGTSNATDSLKLILQGLKIGRGDEVVVPAHTCDATWLAVLAVGATPVGADSELRSHNIDPEAVREAITERTRAIIIVHMNGIPADLGRLAEFGYRQTLHVIEDNSQATGATFRGKRTGTFGVAAAHSFYPTKVLGAFGDGGAITTNEADLATTMKSLRFYGRLAQGSGSTAAHMPGHNMRLDEIQAHWLSLKMPDLDSAIAHRQQLATLYETMLEDVGDIDWPRPHPAASSACHIFSIRTAKRDRLKEYLERQGIGTAIHYARPAHKMPSLFAFQHGQFPNAEAIAAQSLSLPMGSSLSTQSVIQVAEAIKAFFA